MTCNENLQPITESFKRTRRSLVVNINSSEGFDACYLYLEDDSIPLGESYKKGVLSRLKGV